MSVNGVIFQYFEWYLEDNGTLWKRLKDDASHLKEIGITSVWIPPCFKATGTNDTGYGVYDVYDLGEFDQKGSIRTKYGTKEELHQAINALHEKGLNIYADVVLNHKAGADGTDKFIAIEVDPNDRKTPVSDPYEIEGWVRFDFNARNNKYSDFKWRWEHFNGTDFDNISGKKAIFRIIGENKNWSEDVSLEFGNYDYLMFANVDYMHPNVQKEVLKWISWFVLETHVDGLRFDAVKHINSHFMKMLLTHLHNEFGNTFYAVGEYWESNKLVIDNYLRTINYQMDMFDVVLHYNFYRASLEGKNFDMRKIFDDALVKQHPSLSVTFVNNHDSQIGQSLESNVKRWFMPLAYGLIMLRADGFPCIFYGDYYGLTIKESMSPIRDEIDKLLHIRQNNAYGNQIDYFDDKNLIGWVRLGNGEHPNGCAIVMTNGNPGIKKMNVGQMHHGEIWVDKMRNIENPVQIDEQGNGIFKVMGGSISVYSHQLI